MMKCRLLLIPILMLAMAACSGGTKPATTGASPAASPGASPAASPASSTAGNPEAKTLTEDVLKELNKVTDRLKTAASADEIVTIYKDGAAAIRPATAKLKAKFPELYKTDGPPDKAKAIVGEELDKKMNEAGGKLFEASGEAEKRNNTSSESNPDLKAAGEDLFKALSGE
jgi:hypothetical protein